MERFCPECGSNPPHGKTGYAYGDTFYVRGKKFVACEVCRGPGAVMGQRSTCSACLFRNHILKLETDFQGILLRTEVETDGDAQ